MYLRTNNPHDEMIEVEVLSDEFSIDEGHLLMRYAVYYNETHKIEILLNMVSFPVTDRYKLREMYTLCNKIDVLKLSKCIVLTEGGVESKLAQVDNSIRRMEIHINDRYGDLLSLIKEFFKVDVHVPKMMEMGKFPVISKGYVQTENIYS